MRRFKGRNGRVAAIAVAVVSTVAISAGAGLAVGLSIDGSSANQDHDGTPSALPSDELSDDAIYVSGGGFSPGTNREKLSIVCSNGVAVLRTYDGAIAVDADSAAAINPSRAGSVFCAGPEGNKPVAHINSGDRPGIERVLPLPPG